MLIGWPGGSWESTALLVAAILGGYAVVLWLGIIVWTYRDIRERTRDGLSQAVAVLMVVVFNIPGLFLYLVLRPSETLAEAYERRLEAQAIMRDLAEQRQTCPACQRTVKEGFLLCPYCRTRLQASCPGCAQPLALNWVVCPYCGAQGPQPEVAPTAFAQPPLPASGEARSSDGDVSRTRPAPRRQEMRPARAPAGNPTPPRAGSAQ